MLQTVGLLSSLRIMLTSDAGPFLDGFSTASAAFLISLIEGISPLEIAFFTSLYLAGSFIGAAVFGSVADHVGRRPPFIAVMALVGALTALSAAAPSVALLLVMRLLTGVFLGGDYPIGQAIVFEKVPAERRNTALSVLMLAWYLGALFGVCTCIPAVNGSAHWTSVLAVQSILAFAALLLRFGISESESWLAAARSAHNRPPHLRPLAAARNWLAELKAAARENRGHFVFCAAFWLCQTIPATIMMLYSPTILQDMTGSDDAVVQMLLLYGFFLIGVLPAGSRFFATRPRLVLMGTFLTMTAGLLGVLFFAKTNIWLTNASFVLFAASYGLQAPLDFIYPNQLFPTEVRGTLVGAVTAISRIGATGSAFLFPVLEPHLSFATLFGSGAFVLALGFIIGLKFAPDDRLFR